MSRLISSFLFGMALISACGCNHMLAERVVKAPNLSASVGRGVDAPAEELQRLFVDEQLRVNVGPPDASIAVWITDPTRREETLSIDKDNEAVIERKPSTAPSTQPIVTKGTIFLLHGILDRKSMGPYLIFRELLTHDGYRVVQVDLRGHGRSTGDWITFGVVESRDMKQVLDALEQQGKIVGPVGVVGISYGASTAIQWAAIDPRIKAIVALEPFANLRDVAHDAAPMVLGAGKFLFSKADIDKTVDLAGKLAGFDPNDADVVRAIQQSKVPVLLAHSKKDELIPYTHSQRLHDAAKDHSKLLLYEGATHFDLWIKHLETNRAAMLAWFKVKLVNPKPETRMTNE